MKKFISAAIILLAAIVAVPSVAQSRSKSSSRSSRTVSTPTPVDRVVNYLNALGEEISRCPSSYEMQSVISNMTPTRYLDVEEYEFDYKMSDAERSRLTDAMKDLMDAMCQATGGNYDMLAQMYAVAENGIAVASTLREALANMGLNLTSTITGR